MGSESGGSAARRSPRSRSVTYLTEVKARLYAAFHWSMTPFTFSDSMLGFFAHSHGTAAAVPTIALSTSPHALARSDSLVIFCAPTIILSIFGSSSCGQFELFDWVIAGP